MDKIRSLLNTTKSTRGQWIEDDRFELASALSYYTLFSLAPLLLVVMSIAGFACGRVAAQTHIVETLQGMVGQESAKAIQDINCVAWQGQLLHSRRLT